MQQKITRTTQPLGRFCEIYVKLRSRALRNSEFTATEIVLSSLMLSLFTKGLVG